jgi:hypothetical protein
MKPIRTDRRTFIARVLAGVGVAALGDRLERLTAAPTQGDPPPTKPARVVVYEIHFQELRDKDGKPQKLMVESFGLVSAEVLTNEEFPLDGLADLFPEGTSAAILVDARAGTPSTALISKRLARGIIEIGSDPGNVRILDASDADLVAGGYEIVRNEKGLLCHGTLPRPGFGPVVEVPGTGAKARLSLAATPEKTKQLAVVGCLSAAEGKMGPFVIDAALRLVDEESRSRALADPQFGAKLLASDHIGGRIALTVGDLVDVRLGASPAGSPSEAEEAANNVFRGDEVIASTNLFAVERIGHRILTNTLKARGRAAVEAHPILLAAERQGLRGASMETIDWKKGAL